MSFTAEYAPDQRLAFHNALQDLAADLPEVATQLDHIEAGGQEIIEELAVKPEFFAGRAHAIFFSALAQRNADLEASREGMSATQYAAEKGFIVDAATMLTAHHSERSTELRRLVDKEDVFEDDAVEAAYDRFTNKQVTAELQSAIDNGLLDAVKQRLQITDENEEPYVLHVLNIGDRRTLHGLYEPLPEDYFDLEPDHPRRVAHDAHTSELVEYAKGLEANTIEFLRATGGNTLSLAWVVPINGRKHLSITLPTAEKILHPEITNSRYGQSLQDDQATLEHEYAHVQGGLGLDGLVFYGVMAEERRAERKAGDKMGYQDAKGLIDIDLVVIGDAAILKYIDEHVKGGDMHQFFTMLATKWGLQRTLEFALTVPGSYLTDDRPLQKAVNEHIGGFNGFESRLYDSLSSDLQKRAHTIIELWAGGQVDSQTIDSWLRARRDLSGLGFTTDMLEEALARHRAARPQGSDQ